MSHQKFNITDISRASSTVLPRSSLGVPSADLGVTAGNARGMPGFPDAVNTHKGFIIPKEAGPSSSEPVGQVPPPTMVYSDDMNGSLPRNGVGRGEDEHGSSGLGDGFGTKGGSLGVGNLSDGTAAGGTDGEVAGFGKVDAFDARGKAPMVTAVGEVVDGGGYSGKGQRCSGSTDLQVPLGHDDRGNFLESSAKDSHAYPIINVGGNPQGSVGNIRTFRGSANQGLHGSIPFNNGGDLNSTVSGIPHGLVGQENLGINVDISSKMLHAYSVSGSVNQGLHGNPLSSSTINMGGFSHGLSGQRSQVFNPNAFDSSVSLNAYSGGRGIFPISSGSQQNVWGNRGVHDVGRKKSNQPIND